VTTATNPRPDVSLPAGAVADDDAWAFWDKEFRFFRGVDRVVLNAAAEVRTCGMQLPDGTVDVGEDAPSIDVSSMVPDGGLTSAQALKLAAARAV
jgi:hypothetical protein